MLLGRVRKTDTIWTGCNIFHSVLCSFLWLTTTLAFLVSDLFCKLAIALIYVCVCCLYTGDVKAWVLLLWSAERRWVLKMHSKTSTTSIICSTPLTEYRIYFLHLKNSWPCKSICHTPMTMYMKMKYSNYLVLFFDHWIHSIAFYQTKKWERTTCESIDGEDDHFSLPEGVEPLFWMSPYNTLLQV